MSEIHPIHGSVMKVRSVRMERARPHNMAMMSVTNEQRQLVEQIAADIFTDMINAGCTFQAALASIYVSGAQHMAQVTDH